jgi:hypothetical protein
LLSSFSNCAQVNSRRHWQFRPAVPDATKRCLLCKVSDYPPPKTGTRACTHKRPPPHHRARPQSIQVRKSGETSGRAQIDPQQTSRALSGTCAAFAGEPARSRAPAPAAFCRTATNSTAR